MNILVKFMRFSARRDFVGVNSRYVNQFSHRSLIIDLHIFINFRNWWTLHIETSLEMWINNHSEIKSTETIKRQYYLKFIYETFWLKHLLFKSWITTTERRSLINLESQQQDLNEDWKLHSLTLKHPKKTIERYFNHIWIIAF
jgi:hypothetical protein